MTHTITPINLNASFKTSEKTSPFALVNNEQVNFYTDTKGGSFPLHEEDQLILLFVNKYLVLTSNLLEVLLIDHGIEISQHEIQLRLRKLSDAAYLNKAEFITPFGQVSAGKFYTLSYRGRGFIKSIGKTPRMGNFLSEASADRIKKILSAVQYVIRARYEFEDVSVCESVFVMSNDSSKEADSRIFRPYTTVQTPEETIFIESVRKSKSWKADLKNKVLRMNSVFASSEKTNVRCKTPTVIFVAEDPKQMLEIMNFVKKQMPTLNFSTSFTNDQFVFDNPKNCLYRQKTFLESLFAV